MFHNFNQFYIKAATGHHHDIQKELNELLSKGPTEPLTGGVGFHSTVWFITRLIVYDLYSFLSDLIATYLLSRCLL